MVEECNKVSSSRGCRLETHAASAPSGPVANEKPTNAFVLNASIQSSIGAAVREVVHHYTTKELPNLVSSLIVTSLAEGVPVAFGSFLGQGKYQR